jgi:hypothetical protein
MPKEVRGVPRGERDPNRPVYLRVGDWNPDRPYSNNYAKGDIEAGLGVYDLNAAGEPIAPEEGEWAEVDMRALLRSDEPRYLVQGDLVGEGHDGEPLLRNPKVVGMYPDDFAKIVPKLTANLLRKPPELK